MSHFRIFDLGRPALIGMVHLTPLPGSPKYNGDWPAVLESARRDAQALATGGADAVMVENFNDAPFFKTRVPRVTVAAMTAAVLAVRSVAGDLPVGVNVLRNDGRAALAVAMAAQCRFIRVNVLSGARVTDQGVIEGIAVGLLRDRAALGGDTISIWADVDVKHSAALAERSLEDEVSDVLERGGADALIVSGSGTGQPTDPAKLAHVKAAARGAPVLVGSGVTAGRLPGLLPHAAGLIVGTAIKRDGRIDSGLVRRMAEALAG